MLTAQQIEYIAIVSTAVAIWYISQDVYHTLFCKCCTSSHYHEHSTATLLPVMDPLHNLREICKQCILLEDHLVQPPKRCTDCIAKHSLFIEALGEEAVALDKHGDHLELTSTISPTIRAIYKRVLNGEDKHMLSQEVRAMRKKLVPHCANAFRDR